VYVRKLISIEQMDRKTDRRGFSRGLREQPIAIVKPHACDSARVDAWLHKVGQVLKYRLDFVDNFVGRCQLIRYY
jgi:hypothetical protein